MVFWRFFSPLSTTVTLASRYLGSSHTTLYLSKAFSFQLNQKNSVKIVPGFSLLSSCDGLSLEELHLKHLNLQQERRKQKANWKSIQWRGVQGGKENKQDFLPSFHAHLFSSTSHRDSSAKKPCQGLPRLPPVSPKRLCKPMVRCRGPPEPRLRHCQRDLFNKCWLSILLLAYVLVV